MVFELMYKLGKGMMNGAARSKNNFYRNYYFSCTLDWSRFVRHYKTKNVLEFNPRMEGNT